MIYIALNNDELMNKCASIDGLLMRKDYQTIVSKIDEYKDVFINGKSEYAKTVENLRRNIHIRYHYIIRIYNIILMKKLYL